MGRPRRVIFENFSQYDKFHTIKQKMYCGVELTVLHAIKETAQYWMSPEVWAWCATKFRKKKKFLPELSVEIPVLTDEKALAHLDKGAWHDWVTKERKDTDIKEAIQYMKQLFPNHEYIYFYELDRIISEFTNGSLIPDKSPTEHMKWVNLHIGNKNDWMIQYPEVKVKFEAYSNSKGTEAEKSKLYSDYSDLAKQVAWDKQNMMSVLNTIGENTICYPVAFSKGTAEWAIEKYGSSMEYSNAGEIFFVVTPDKIYFETKRHY